MSDVHDQAAPPPPHRYGPNSNGGAAAHGLRPKAVRVAEACAQAWAGAHAGTDLTVPVSVVAGISLITPPEPTGPDLVEQLTGVDGEQFLKWLRAVWTQVVSARPDMMPTLYPLVSWLYAEEISDPVRHGAQAVAHAVLRAGLMDLTGSDRRHDIDVLGVLWTHLQPPAARAADGTYATPSDVADLVAAVAGATGFTDGATVFDPACGTGSLFRAAAAQMRRTGRDPAAAMWVGIDREPLAAACCAVNAITWGLGHRVIIGVGDSLADPDIVERAIAMRRECLQVAATIRSARVVDGNICQIGASGAGPTTIVGPDPSGGHSS